MASGQWLVVSGQWSVKAVKSGKGGRMEDGKGGSCLNCDYRITLIVRDYTICLKWQWITDKWRELKSRFGDRSYILLDASPR